MLSILQLTLVVSWVQLSLQQGKDPVADFCRRFGHQTSLIDRRLYIDGGMVNWENDKANYTNKWLVYSDMDDISEGDMPQLKSGLSKDASVPIVSGGVLWSDRGKKAFYQFGGEFDQVNSIEESTLWAYDITSDKWNAPEESTKNIPLRLAWGAGATVSDRLEGYLYGGLQSNLTTTDWTGPPRASSRLLAYSIESSSWKNSSGPDDIGRSEGSMHYLPASDAGLLIHFGGVLDSHQNGTFEGADMSEIHIYDIQSARWYTQKATGDIPESRRRFCADVTWPQDQSSYNVYMYGGLANAGGPGFDDVYVLTMPAFRWVRWWTSEAGKGIPHHSLSCNIVDGAQMIIMGGTFPMDPLSCDAPTVWGTHNLRLGGPDGNIKWEKFDSSLKEYLVPSNVTNIVGGGQKGGATVTSPAAWDHQDLDVFFSLKVTPSASPSSTSPPGPPSTSPSSGGLSTGAIAGAAVGGAIGLILILSVVWCFFRRRKEAFSRRRPELSQAPMSPHYVQHAQPHHAPTYTWNTVPNELEAPGTEHKSVPVHNISAPATPHVENLMPYASHQSHRSQGSVRSPAEHPMHVVEADGHWAHSPTTATSTGTPGPEHRPSGQWQMYPPRSPSHGEY